jgi:hypothetical protein
VGGGVEKMAEENGKTKVMEDRKGNGEDEKERKRRK